ncbi:MAG: hypothetical protein HY904_12555 [Deltaproteobacteria bacterium]|nr:hypothetical protein [Deltaproteobacteria bacterium]
MMAARSKVALGVCWVLACTPEPERKLTVMVASLPLRAGGDTSSPPVATVRLGSPLKGTPPGWLDSKEHWNVRLNDGRTVQAPMAAVVEVLPAPVQMSVAGAEALRLKEPYPKGQVLERLGFGTAVQVIRETPSLVPGFGITLTEGRLTGFIALESLAAAAPSVDDAVTRAAELALEGRLDDAAALARAVAHSAPQHADANALAAALLRALGDPAAAVFRRRVPDEKPVLPPADPDLAPGVVAYTSAPAVPARRGPGATVRPVMWFSLNTRLAVKGTDGKWARVAYKGVVAPVTVVASPLEPPPEAPPPAKPAARKAPQKPAPAEVELYVPAGLLAAGPVDKKTLRADAKAATAEGRHAEAVYALQRLLALDPADAAAIRDLPAAALAARRFDVMVDAIQRARGAPATLLGLEVETVEWVWGCRGTPGETVPSPAEDDVAKLKPRGNTCVREVEVEPACAPCEAVAADADTGLFDREMMKFRESERARVLDAVDRFEKGRRVRADAVTRLEQLFPDRAWCHVRLRNRQPTATVEGQKFVVARTGGAGDGSAPEVATGLVTLPVLRTQQTADLWLRLPGGPGAGCWLFNARNPDAVRKPLTDHLAGEERRLPPHRVVTLSRRTCSCLGG